MINVFHISIKIFCLACTLYNLHTLLYMKKEKCLRFDILMEIFCLACTYIVQTYNYSRVKKVHEHIPHMQSSWGLLFMD